MTPKMNRRNALATLGTVSLGTVLAACGGDDDEGPSQVTTEEGTTTSVEPKTTDSLTELFDEAGSCRLTTELTEGPYYFDVDSIRSDIREDRRGTPLRLAIRVREDGSCDPLENAVVDVWHCDATGVYSGFESASQGGPPGGGSGPTDDETYLRGAQATNSDGVVQFKTIYPGRYPGRATHVHVKVHLDRTTLLTTQLFFDEKVNEAVYANEPYSNETGGEVTNDADGIFDESLIATARKDGDGYVAAINFDVKRA
jgi:protocatechuate 3,4-dioxygenase beta subunit